MSPLHRPKKLATISFKSRPSPAGFARVYSAYVRSSASRTASHSSSPWARAAAIAVRTGVGRRGRLDMRQVRREQRRAAFIERPSGSEFLRLNGVRPNATKSQQIRDHYGLNSRSESHHTPELGKDSPRGESGLARSEKREAWCPTGCHPERSGRNGCEVEGPLPVRPERGPSTPPASRATLRMTCPSHASRLSLLDQGADRSRTGDGGFADLCLTTWLRRRMPGDSSRPSGQCPPNRGTGSRSRALLLGRVSPLPAQSGVPHALQ